MGQAIIQFQQTLCFGIFNLFGVIGFAEAKLTKKLNDEIWQCFHLDMPGFNHADRVLTY